MGRWLVPLQSTRQETTGRGADQAAARGCSIKRIMTETETGLTIARISVKYGQAWILAMGID
jgi:hypothetical protein